MKIVVLQGSPHKNGSTAMVVEQFEKGAVEAGHEVIVIHTSHVKVSPCKGCEICDYGYEGYGKGKPCPQKDDMAKCNELIYGCDMLVFATPLYFYGFSGELRVFMDRMLPISEPIKPLEKKSAILSVAWDPRPEVFDGLRAHYDLIVKNLRFRDQGRIMANNCGSPADTAKSPVLQEAYELGRSLTDN